MVGGCFRGLLPDASLIIFIPPTSEIMFTPDIIAPITTNLPDIEGFTQKSMAPSIVIIPPIIIIILSILTRRGPIMYKIGNNIGKSKPSMKELIPPAKDNRNPNFSGILLTRIIFK